MKNQAIENTLINLFKKKDTLQNKEGVFPLIQSIGEDNLNVNITFVYIGDEKTKNIMVISSLGNKEKQKNLMTNIEGTYMWYKTYVGRNDMRFKYYFLEEATGNKYYDRLNQNKLIFDDGTKVSYVIMPNSKSVLLGKFSKVKEGMKIKREIYSKFLKKFIKIWIYLPYNYEMNSNKHKMGIFIDGKEHINIISADIILNNLIFNHKIEPIVGVFIESTSNRVEELRCNKNFEKFIIHEILPFMKKNYNISENNNLIAGFSLGGLMATYIGLRNNDLFHSVLSQSGSYYFKFRDIRRGIRRCSGNLKFYMDTGILENEKFIIEPNKRIYGLLRKYGFKVKYEKFKGGHDYLCWGEFLARGLINLIGNQNSK